MTWVSVGLGVAGLASGAISGNQSRQDAKGAAGLTNQAVNTANQNYADRAPLRTAGTAQLLAPKTYDLSSIYRTNADPLGAAAEAAQGQTLASLANTPSVDAQVKQALANYDSTALPALAASRRATGQSASALGRIGDQINTTQLGNLENAYETNRNVTESNAITAAINQAQQNKYQTASTLAQLAGQRQGVQQQGVQNRAAQFGAQQGAEAQDFGQGMSIANLGYGATPASTDLSGAANLTNSANQAAQGANAALGTFGQSIANLTKPKTTTGFTDPSMAGIGAGTRD